MRVRSRNDAERLRGDVKQHPIADQAHGERAHDRVASHALAVGETQNRIQRPERHSRGEIQTKCWPTPRESDCDDQGEPLQRAQNARRKLSARGSYRLRVCESTTETHGIDARAGAELSQTPRSLVLDRSLSMRTLTLNRAPRRARRTPSWAASWASRRRSSARAARARFALSAKVAGELSASASRLSRAISWRIAIGDADASIVQPRGVPETTERSSREQIWNEGEEEEGTTF